MTSSKPRTAKLENGKIYVNNFKFNTNEELCIYAEESFRITKSSLQPRIFYEK